MPSPTLLAQRPTWTRRRKIALGGVVSITVLICCAFAWEPVVECGISLGCPQEVTLEEVSGRAELDFPPGSELTGGEAEYWIDWWMYAVVRFPADELDGFVAANGLPEPVPGKLRAEFGDIAPEPSGTVFATIGRTCTEFACRDMVLVLDDPATVEAHVYVVENTGPADPSESPS